MLFRSIAQPLFTQYCDGRRTQCGGLSQWGSQALGEQGWDAVSILRKYYGSDIYLKSAEKVEGVPLSYGGQVLSLGSEGEDVRTIQTQLNRISDNYPAIPKVPATGALGEETESAVRTFQRIFSLTQDGIVGKATWYKLVYLYVGVRQLAELVSQGQTFYAFQFQFPGVLAQGDSGPEVEVLQYMLSMLAQFSSTLRSPAIDGDFGPVTAQAVRTYQVWAGLTPDGVVGENTWNSIYDSFVTADYQFRRDTVRAQSLREDAVPVMGQASSEQGPDRWDNTPRLGQYQGSPMKPGQRDGPKGRRRGVEV